ncbi:FAD-binding oxidoreductase [Candidatus Saccharibacteria bacterium]|nr:FAD-binding oxidoreductase [Candidatus Saccharibacteria bacterium]
MNKIAIYLNRHLTGNIYDKDSILEAYSTDMSLLKVKPRFVALPESTSDVRKLVKFVNQLAEKKYDLPISVRGSGLSKSGADLSKGIVLSTERLNHVRELDAHDHLVHVQAGITLGKLNAVLAPYGLTLPVFAEPEETIGSLISNCPKDRYSGKYGGIMNYIDRAEIVLSSGDILQTSRLGKGALKKKQSGKSFESKIYKKLDETLKSNSELLEKDQKSLGYPALKHIRRNNGRVFDILPAFFGAEGNLGIITEVILRLETISPRPHRLFGVFKSEIEALEFYDLCAKFTPLYAEIFDNKIFENLDEYGKKPDLLEKNLEKGYIVLVSFNDKSKKSRNKVRKIEKKCSSLGKITIETVQNSADFDDFETSIKMFLNDETKSERGNLLNDFYLPRKSLSEFLKAIKSFEKSSKKPLELFGNFSTEIFSLRPSFDLKKVDERRTAMTLMRDINDLLNKTGGALAGGLPEGRLKSIVIYPELEKPLKDLYAEVKDIFDPNNIFAPETKTNYDTRSAVRSLRTETLSGIIK